MRQERQTGHVNSQVDRLLSLVALSGLEARERDVRRIRVLQVGERTTLQDELNDWYRSSRDDYYRVLKKLRQLAEQAQTPTLLKGACLMKHERAPELHADVRAAVARARAATARAAAAAPVVAGDWQYALVGLRAAVVEEVEKALAAGHLSRAELARRMNCSRQHVSKILNESENFQLETIAKLAVALDRELAFRLIASDEQVIVRKARERAVVIEGVPGRKPKTRRPPPQTVHKAVG